MKLLSHYLTLYGFIITMHVVQGYILFAANVEDLKNMAKIIAPDNVAKVIRQTSLNPDDPVKTDANENGRAKANNKKTKTTNAAEGRSDSRENVKRTVDLTRFQDANQYLIYQLAEKIKQRVMNELVFKFLNAKREKERRDRMKEAKGEHANANHRHDDDDEIEIILKPIEVSADTAKHGRPTRNKHGKHLNTEFEVTKDKIHKTTTTKRRGGKRTTDFKPIKVEFNEDVRNKHKHKDKHREYARIDSRMNKINFYKRLVEKKTRSDRTWSVGGRKPTTYPSRPETYVKLVIDNDGDHNDHVEGGLDDKMEKGDDSNRPTRYKLKHNNAKNDDDGNGDGGDEMRSSTSYLWFDDNVNDTMIMTEGRMIKTDVLRNTMMPRQQRYSMTSPNYYGSLPTVVERYNFKEPLPKRNRKRKRNKWVKKYP